LNYRGLLLTLFVISSLVPPLYAQTTITADYTAFDAKLDTEKGELTLTKWGTTVKITIPSLTPTASSLTDEKTELTYSDYKCSVYETIHGIEWDIVLTEKPQTNSFTLKVDSTLKWYYQPPLTEIFKQEECSVWTPTRIVLKTGETIEFPENVTGSYAVYGSRQGNQYKTGKYMHIYRPRIYDAKGGETWGDLSYDGGLLTVTVDPIWLEKAVYPVTIDPSFGKTDVGASTVAYSNPHLRASNGTTSVAGGTLDSVTFYGYTSGGWAKGWGAVYDASANLVEGETTGTNVTTVADWHTVNMLGTTNLAGSTLYWATAQLNKSTTGANVNFKGDYMGSGSGVSRGDTSFTVGGWQDPATWFNYDYHVSVYANYTEAGGPTAYERNATLATTWGGDASRQYQGSRAGTQGFTVNADGLRSYYGVRSPNMPLSFAANATRRASFHRTLTGIFTFTFTTPSGINRLIIYVTDTLNRGIESAIIAVWGTTGTLEATGETNSTGYYDAGNVADGNYTILAQGENYQTSINIYTISTSELIVVTLTLIEEAVYMYLPWVLITLLGCITLASPRMIQDRALRMLSYPISVILWLTAAYIWAVLQANSNLFPITYLHLVPVLISAAWGITDLGTSLSKRDKYERI